MTVALVADSSCCLPADVVSRLGVHIVPLSYEIEGEMFRDGDDSARKFYARLRKARGRATTQAPAPGDFVAAYQRAVEAGADSVLCLTLPASYSATYDSACLAAREMPDRIVRVVDSGGLAMVHGFAVMAAASAAATGSTVDECAQAAVETAAKARLVGALESTRYLAKTGRVPLVLHWASAALRMRPVFAADGAKTRGVGRARTASGAAERMLQYVARHAEPGPSLHVAVMHADAEERAQALAAALTERFSPGELMTTEFTPVMGIHTGPGLLAVAFYAE